MDALFDLVPIEAVIYPTMGIAPKGIMDHVAAELAVEQPVHLPMKVAPLPIDLLVTPLPVASPASPAADTLGAFALVLTEALSNLALDIPSLDTLLMQLQNQLLHLFLVRLAAAQVAELDADP